MSATVLARVEAAIQQLSFDEQLLLMEHLAHQIRVHTQPLDMQLATMAADPAIQSELRQIADEFQEAEFDGLGD